LAEKGREYNVEINIFFISIVQEAYFSILWSILFSNFIFSTSNYISYVFFSLMVERRKRKFSSNLFPAIKTINLGVNEFIF